MSRKVSVMLLGDCRVGKTYFQSAYPVQKQDPSKKFSPFVSVFPSQYLPTRGIARVEKTFRYTGNDQVKLDPLTVIEMPGDNVGAMGQALQKEEKVEELRSADLFVFVVSLENPASLDGVRKLWYPLAHGASMSTPVCVVATHAECGIQGASEAAQQLAESIGAFSYAEVSLTDPRKFIPIVNAWQVIISKVLMAPSKSESPLQHWHYLADVYVKGHGKTPNVSGFMMKKGHGISAKEWKKRWVEVHEGKLYYWKKREDPSSLAGTLELNKCLLSLDETCFGTVGRPAAPALVLTIESSKRQYHFVCSDITQDVDEDIDNWGFCIIANGAEVTEEAPALLGAAPVAGSSSNRKTSSGSRASRSSRRSGKSKSKS